MQDAKLKSLGEAVEAAGPVAGRIEAEVRAALAAAGLSDAADLDTTDAVLQLVDAALPGWAVSMEGTASATHGHWTCTLRRSRERDNDEAIGIGRGPEPATALLAALIKVLALRPVP